MTLMLDLNYTQAQIELFFTYKEKFIVCTKGRRLGATKGAAQAFIEYALEGITPLLWGDTINGNIDRYYQRYFLPVLKKLPSEIEWEWNQEKRLLQVGQSVIDMRSADRPENWEGFGYKKIFLNEAGIILKDDYLYTNAILPMLLDFPDSQLIAAGVPKGKKKRNGQEHKFYTLYKAAKENKKGNYRLLEYSSYDNPYLNQESLKELEDEFMMLGMSSFLQEIKGQFIDIEIGGSPFMSAYSSSKHESIEAIYQPGKQVMIAIDFNIDPFSIIFAHIFRDANGYHCHIFDEVEIQGGSIPTMIDVLWNKQNDYPGYLRNCFITGDSMGKQRDISQRDLSSHYMKLRKGLGLRESQFKLPNNPRHADSRVDCNFLLTYFPDFKINPEKCSQTCLDMKIVQCDNDHKIIKSNRLLEDQKADMLDCVRYLINTFLTQWIDTKEKSMSREKRRLLQ